MRGASWVKQNLIHSEVKVVHKWGKTSEVQQTLDIIGQVDSNQCRETDRQESWSHQNSISLNIYIQFNGEIVKFVTC